MADTSAPVVEPAGDLVLRRHSDQRGVGSTIPLSALSNVPVLIDTGPTGRSAYWELLFSVLHPERATTDTIFNLVDEVWAQSPVRVQILLRGDLEQAELFALDPADAAPSLADVVQDLRDRVALPVTDLAAMLGLRRRQFYNLLSGSRASTERERWIRTLSAAVRRVSADSAASPQQLRAAILQPLHSGRSLYELACALDEDGVAHAVSEVGELLGRGQLSERLPRPSPRLSRHGNAGSAADFLSDYRERDLESEER